MIEAPPRFAVDDAQYQRLTPTLRVVARDPNTGRLARAIALTQGFSLQLIGCETPLVAQALILCLARQVSELRGAEVKMARLVPARPMGAAESVEGAALIPQALDPQELGREVFDRLFAEDPEPRVLVLDATDSRSDDRPAWIWLFQRLNERRNHLKAIGVPLVFLLPFELELELPPFAPDLWSIRSVAARFTGAPSTPSEGASEGGSALRRLEALEPPAFEYDAAKLRAELEDLLQQPGPHARRAMVAVFARLTEELEATGELQEARALLQERILPAIEGAPEAQRAELMFDLTQSLVSLLPPAEVDRLARSRTLPRLEQTGDDAAIALVLASIADGYRDHGDFDEALRILVQEALPRGTRQDPRTRAELLSRVAILHLERGDLAAAQAIIDAPDLLSLAPVTSAEFYLRLARHQKDAGKTREAVATLRHQVLPMSRSWDSPDVEALAWVLLGMIHRDRGELQTAMEIWKTKALSIYQRLGNREGQGVVQIHIAAALDALGRRDAALAYLRRHAVPAALAPAATARAARPRTDALLELATAFERLGATEDAAQLRRDAVLPAPPASPGRQLDDDATTSRAPAAASQHTAAGPEIYEADSALMPAPAP